MIPLASWKMEECLNTVIYPIPRKTSTNTRIVFEKEVNLDAFNNFNILHLENEGRVYQLVAKGNQEEVLSQIEAMHPILVDVLQVSFEELFIYELEGRSKSNDQ